MIKVNNLTKVYKTPIKTGNMFADFFARQYKENRGVNEISFSIEENEVIGFIGPNGAGKTTTLKMLSGILYPTSGTVEILGYKPFDKKAEFLKQIGFVMGQKNQLLWDLPATDTFEVNKAIYGISDKNYKSSLSELIELLECQSFLDQPVKTLSLGQRMRVEFIASLLHRPKVLFLDEPTIGLDIFAQTTIRKFIKEYQKRYNSIIILTSHYMQDVVQLAKRVILINHGSILFDNSLESLIDTYSQEKVISLHLGKPLQNEKALLKELNYSYKYPQLSITVTKKDIPKTLTKLLPMIDYIDLTIENEDIEDVIKRSLS